MWVSCGQITARISAEPKNANQNGAVTPHWRATSPPIAPPDHDAAEDADEVDAADAALQLGRHGALAHAARRRTPDEGVRAEDEEDRQSHQRASW